MNKSVRDLIRRYDSLSGHHKIVDSSERYAGLVTANGNRTTAVQRWFHAKEAFSIRLLEEVVTDLDISLKGRFRVLDPFCGTGTSLLSAQRLAKVRTGVSVSVYGIERNPFLHFVAKTKAGWHTCDADRFDRLADSLMTKAARTSDIDLPPLSTLRRRAVFEPSVVRRLLALRQAIRSVRGPERNLLMMGLAGVFEDVSGVRKDGRALRIEPSKQRPRLRDALKTAWDSISEDLDAARALYKPIRAKVVLGDGRHLEGVSRAGPFDLLLYSPPYLNNIDYSEVYKLELWLCGFVKTPRAFRALRQSTLRSHPSIRFDAPVSLLSDERLALVTQTVDLMLAALPEDPDYARGRAVFKPYFDDIYQSLQSQASHLRPGGLIACIVGNSLHGPRDDADARVPIATDLLVAEIGRSIGLKVLEVCVARHLRRRAPYARHLRESIVVMQKHSRSAL